MKRLILMRHAKSSWTDPLMHDAARPLNDRGRAAAPRMGAWMAEQGLIPDLALVSTAQRCLETWELAAAEMGAPARRSVEAIYESGPELLLALVQEVPDEVEVLMLVGHEPGVPELLRRLSDDRPAEGCARAFGKYPTGAVAALKFKTLDAWAELAPGTGRLTRYAQPRDFD